MATISAFREALSRPRSGFCRMSRLRWDGEIRRSTYFAEAQVECGTERYMVYMPLAMSSLRRAERFIPLHRHLLSSFVPRVEILRSEMRYEDSVGNAMTCDIMREPLPAGEPFADALAAIADEEDARRLICSVDELQGALLLANLSHNAVREENIVVCADGSARLLRWYYATEGVGGDDEAFDALREKIRSMAASTLREPAQRVYNVEASFDDHLYVRPLHEGLAAVEEATGWGFVDSENRMVIEPRFRWVGDFEEGRAEVQTLSGMGVINREGGFVVPALYDSVEYDSHSGCTTAWRGEVCVVFDYEGRVIADEELPAYPPPYAEAML